MGYGFEIYAPDGALQLSNTTKIISNTPEISNFLSTLSYDYAEYGSYIFCDPQTKAGLRYEYMASNFLGTKNNTHLVGLQPMDCQVCLFDNIGQLYSYSDSLWANGSIKGKFVTIPAAYVPPVISSSNHKLLTVYDDSGNAVWTLPDFLKSPQIVDYLSLPITADLTTVTHPLFSYTLPSDINIDKVFFMLMPPSTTSWDKASTDGSKTLYCISMKRVGRTFYFLPILFINSMGYVMTSCDSNNRNSTTLSSFAGTSLDVAVIYLAT